MAFGLFSLTGREWLGRGQCGMSFKRIISPMACSFPLHALSTRGAFTGASATGPRATHVPWQAIRAARCAAYYEI